MLLLYIFSTGFGFIGFYVYWILCLHSLAGSVVDGDVGSTKGSIVFGPDGAVIKVGETIKLSARASEGVQDVQDANMYPTGLRGSHKICI